MSCPGQSSDLLTTATQVSTRQGVLQAIAATGGTVIVYDSANSTTTGKKILAKVIAPATATTTVNIDEGTSFMYGLYVTVSAGDAVVYFKAS